MLLMKLLIAVRFLIIGVVISIAWILLSVAETSTLTGADRAVVIAPFGDLQVASSADEAFDLFAGRVQLKLTSIKSVSGLYLIPMKSDRIRILSDQYIDYQEFLDGVFARRLNPKCLVRASSVILSLIHI